MRGIGWGLIGLILLSSCRREVFEPQAGQLRFSREIVLFDSLFSTLLSPTQRLWVYNPHPYPIEILSVRLEKGTSSPFRFWFDGQEGPIQRPYILGRGDSVQAFLNLRDTSFIDASREDRLLFETRQGVQSVLLKATLIAAYVYRDFGFDSALISLPSDKPIVIDGYFYVGAAGILRISPGTRLYFSGRRWESGPLRGELSSGIYVAGSLEALGTPEAPIFMQAWRLEPYYATAAGQWQGLWFFPSSQNNRLSYLRLTQSSIGIRIDSAGGPTAPKVHMEGCIITDAANFGILAQGFSPTLPSQPILQAVNTLIYRCGQACAAFLGGGKYRLIHCSFLYDQGDLRRGLTSLVLTDFLRTETEVRTYPLDFSALNTLLWSTKADAVTADLRGSGSQLYTYCALRQQEALPGEHNLYLADPGLGRATDRYPLLEGSPLIDAGHYFPLWSPSKDLLGRPRDEKPDIGAYEYVR